MAIVYMAITFMITLLYHISPLIWEVRRLEICRPAASSLALLIRRPEESLWYEVFRAKVELASFRCALIELTLVLTYKAIVCFSHHEP